MMRRDGMTLLEVAFALFIVSIALLAVIQLYQFGMDRTRDANETALVMAAIQNEIELLRTLTSDELTARNGESFHRISGALDRLPMATQVTCNAAGVPGLYEVTAAATYSTRSARIVEKSITTWIAPEPAP